MKFLYTLSYLFALFLIIVAFYFWGNNIFSIVIENLSLTLIFITLSLVSLIKPKMMFLLLVASLPFEIMSLSVDLLKLDLRPYQIISFALFVSVIINLTLKNQKIKIPKIHILDITLAILSFTGFLGVFLKGLSMHGEIVIISFFSLYILTRIFITDKQDVINFIKVFLVSATLVSIYGLVQNYLSIHGIYHNNTMNERPNATFSEPDWFGMFLAISLSFNYSIFYFITKRHNYRCCEYIKYLNFFSFFIIVSALIITVSRSAWLAAILSTVLFFVLIFLKNNFKNAIKTCSYVVAIIIISFIFVKYANFTNFSLSNRISSTTSGKQNITIACEKNLNITEIKNISELDSIGCSHIKLEEIAKEKENGKYVKTVVRPDPNVNIRYKIYKKSWENIKDNWILGLGWGSSQKLLGVDEAGTPLNTSNVFLEIWLSVGIIGLCAFIFFATVLVLQGFKNLFFSKETLSQTYGIFGILCLIDILVSNMFNAGLFLGFMWVLFGIIVALYYEVLTEK